MQETGKRDTVRTVSAARDLPGGDLRDLRDLARNAWRLLTRRDRPPRTAEELRLAGRLNGLLYASAGILALVTVVLPGSRIHPVSFVVAVATACVLFGVALLVRGPWTRWPAALSHASSIAGLVMVAALTPATGGPTSAIPALLFYVVIYAAFFYTPRHAVAYWAACGVVRALPLAYAPRAIELNTLRQVAVEVPIYFIVGTLVVAGRGLLAGVASSARALEASEAALIDQQSSLRRVATAVAAGAPPEGIFALVSAEAGRLLDAGAAAIVRFEAGGGHAMVMGTWAAPEHGGEGPRVGDLEPLREGGPLARVQALGGLLRLQPEDRAQVLQLGPGGVLVAPVHTGTKVWGAVVAVRPRGGFPAEAGARLQEYADLIATAIANAEDRVLLARQAGRDPLTDLLNHRAFHERLAGEVSRAQRHGRPLAVGVVDVDRFRDLNDRAGTEAADAALVEIAARVREGVRDEDVVARLIGDSFGVIFVESDPAEARAAAERARSRVADRPLRHGLRATVSVGMSDLDSATVAEDLVQRAALALAHAKEAGGDRVHRFAPDETPVDGRGGMADDLDRSHALLGLRALARAIDAKDPATREHSDNVAALASRLAAVRGWDARAIARLREAALLHDVGKIGVPDAILLKPGALTDGEREIVQDHAPLGAHMVAGVLEDDQVAWIAAHHERPDRTGYPARLGAGEIPEGASLLALADAWDLMTRDRPYARRRTVEEALAEAAALAGRQFAPAAVRALEALYERGELTLAAARLHEPEAA